ncbi:MAG: hypothetical protein ACR5LD_02710 [Symbiopectobacterium sp.]
MYPALDNLSEEQTLVRVTRTTFTHEHDSLPFQRYDEDLVDAALSHGAFACRVNTADLTRCLNAEEAGNKTRA